MHGTRAACLAGAAASLLLVVSACGLPKPPSQVEPEPVGTPTVVVASGAPVDPGGSSTPVAPTATSTAPGAGPAGDQPFAARPGSIDKVKVQATLYPVRRTGDTSTVNLYVAADNPDDTFMLLNSLGDGNTETSSKSLTSVDGIKLVDPVAKKAYLPAVTADGQCVCSPDDANTGEIRNAVWVTVTFAAPPAQLTAINVTVPTFGTFTDVPIQ